MMIDPKAREGDMPSIKRDAALTSSTDQLRWIQQPPPREEAAVAALTQETRRRARRIFRPSLGVIVLGVLICIFAPPSRANSQLNLILPIGVMFISFGFLFILVALYYSSHVSLFKKMVLSSPVYRGNVMEIIKGYKGSQSLLVDVFTQEGVYKGKLIAEGQVFDKICEIGEELPCLIDGRYGGVLMSSSELVLCKYKST